MASVNPADISVRPASDRDEAFLRATHDAARHWEFAVLLQNGQDDLYHKVMAQQYASQHAAYSSKFPAAHYGVIEYAGKPIGRLYVDYRDDEVRVLDIGILPDYRGHGIGQIVLKGICIEAGMRRLPVRLHVHFLSRARALYDALGFVQTGAEGPHCQMEWRHGDPDALLRGRFLPQSVATPPTEGPQA
jgi:GNAT superfamily N-acetyltransferase